MFRILRIAAVALLVLPAVASAQEVVAPDPEAREATTLDGTLVWISGAAPGQTLMQRSRDGVVGPVKGAAEARFYRSPDLGRDASGRLVLTYVRCESRCVSMRDDLAGTRTPLRGYALKNCSLATAPSLWRRRAAYGLSCFKRVDGRRIADDTRTGLYVRTGTGTPRRLSTPRQPRKYGIHDVTAADLRGNRVAAVYADIYSFQTTQDFDGTGRRTFLGAASEGDGDGRISGLALATAKTTWSLVNATHAGDPNETRLHRVVGPCHDWQSMDTPEDSQDFAAIDVAAAGSELFLVVPGVGIVRHAYAPDKPCGT